jgi:ketol-acid reductoisomerase
MYHGVSETARFGGLTVGANVINQETKQRMREALQDIQSGAFADRWVTSYRNEKARAFDKYMDELEAHPIEQVGRRLRQMMWPDDTKAGKVASWSKLSKKSASAKKKAKPKKQSPKKKRAKR